MNCASVFAFHATEENWFVTIFEISLFKNKVGCLMLVLIASKYVSSVNLSWCKNLEALKYNICVCIKVVKKLLYSNEVLFILV